MHHAAESDSANMLEFGLEFFGNFIVEILETILQAGPNIFKGVGPETVLVAVFPIVASRCNRLMVFINQYCLDAR